MLILGIILVLAGIIYNFRRTLIRLTGKKARASIVGYHLIKENKSGDTYKYRILYDHKDNLHYGKSIETFKVPHGHYPFAYRYHFVHVHFNKHKDCTIDEMTYPDTLSLFLIIGGLVAMGLSQIF